MKRLAVVLFIVGISLIVFKFIKNNSYPVRYIGYFYPYYGKTEIFLESTPINTIEECREWVEVQYDNYQYKDTDSKDYDYECGKDCYLGDKYSAGVNYTCKTSVD